MSIFVIGDLHLPGHQEKPMNVFGSHWDRHFDTITQNWLRLITDNDIVLIPGDISWAMQLSQAVDDLKAIAALPGRKVLLRGNHDYWWSSLNKIKAVLPDRMYVVQNDALKLDDYVFCGTRGWMFPTEQTPLDTDNEKIYQRELIRLEMSLKAAAAMEAKEKVVMLHFPPLYADGYSTGFTDLLEKYNVHHVVYGHLHAAGIKNGFVGERNGVQYTLTSCDSLGFVPLCLIQTT